MLPEPAIQWLGPAQPLLDGQTRDELVAQGLKHKALALSGVVECSSGSPRIVLGGRVKGTTKIAPVQGFCSSVAASLKNGNTSSWVSTATRLPPLGTTSAATGAPTLPLPKSVEQVQDGRDVPAPAAAREHAAGVQLARDRPEACRAAGANVLYHRRESRHAGRRSAPWPP